MNFPSAPTLFTTTAADPGSFVADDGTLSSWRLERRDDGAVLVRVPSRPSAGGSLPDAVFAFRAGDPQFSFWEQQLRRRGA